MVRCHMGPGSAAHRRRDAALRPEHESGECGPTWFDIVMASAATCPLEPLGEGGSNPESLRSGSLDCFVTRAPRNDGARRSSAFSNLHLA